MSQQGGKDFAQTQAEYSAQIRKEWGFDGPDLGDDPDGDIAGYDGPA